MAPETKAPAATPEAAQTGTRVRWDDKDMKSSYANVCNVASTREEVVLLFGINQTWNAAQREVAVQLTDRIILSPFAAKRLSILLENVLKEYESRFGALPDPRST
jgi:hypothetical protein